MKTLIQKIHVEEDHSFACRTYRTPTFETTWHKHEEFEIILITEGHGSALIGDYVGEYNTTDVFYLSGNLPHSFMKHNPKMTGAGKVIHFKKEVFGDVFWQMPELKLINNFLHKNEGLQLENGLKDCVTPLILQMENARGFERVHLLLQCLKKLATSTEHQKLTQNFESSNKNINPAIEKIIDYSFKHFLEPITLQQVAAVAEMSTPTFCRFFKKNIKKTYFDFLQELRIGHACKLLSNTNKPVTEVCYESGYNSWAHFSKQFKHVKKTTPSKYRKDFTPE